MASVYEATDLRLNRKVALKVLGHEVSENTDFRERFMRESRFAASLDHPNIVPIYEAGEANGLLYIAMRYVRGSNLAALLRRNGPLDPKRALAILSPVADALDTAHNAGLVHRDVKPANILLTSTAGHEGHEHPYLTDFGLTKRTSALTKLTATGNFIGTMAYISPEQIRGEPLDARTDLYALGCVAYECLTGAPPFVRDDQAALLWAHLNDIPAAASEHRDDLRPADAVLARVLAKRPLNRYMTCDQFAQALSDVLLTGRHSPSTVHTVASAPPDPTSAAAIPVSNQAAFVEAPLAGDSQRAGISQEQSLPVPGHAEPRIDDSSAVASREHIPSAPPGAGQSVDGTSAAAVRSNGSDGPAARSQPEGGRPTGAGRTPEPDEPLEGRALHSDPALPPAVGRPLIRRRPRRRAVLTVVAAMLAVAAIVVVVVLVRPTTVLESGTGMPTGTPAAGAGSAPSDATASTDPSELTEDYASAGALPSAVTEPTAPVTAVPAASVAIPTIDGEPIQVGKGGEPGFVTMSPNGRVAYIANRSGFVTVLDTAVNKVLAQIPVPAGPPQFIAVTPDGSRAYVSIFNTDKTINLVAVLDTRTARLLTTIPVQQKPYALAVTPDQRFVYVPSHDAAEIDIIDIGTNKVVQQVPVAPNPHWVTFTPDGKTAYIADHESNVLSVLDTASNTVVQTIGVGTSPHSVAVSPDGKQVAVVCFDSNDLFFIDTATNQVQGSVPVGTNPQDVTYAPDGRYVYTADVLSNTVSVVDTETRTVTASIPTDSPTSVAVAPNGLKAYVTNLNTGTLTVLNTAG